MPRTLTTDDLCELLDIDPKTVTRWVGRGCPCDKPGRGKKRLFDETEVAAWMLANNLTGKIGKPSEPMSEQMAAAKLRKELALAERHETATARDKGLLVDRAEVERSNVQKFTVIRNRFMGLPASAATTLEGKSPPEIEAELDARIREILAELSQS